MSSSVLQDDAGSGHHFQSVTDCRMIYIYFCEFMVVSVTKDLVWLRVAMSLPQSRELEGELAALKRREQNGQAPPEYLKLLNSDKLQCICHVKQETVGCPCKKKSCCELDS